MTWNYSGDPANSELDKYRFIIGDTDENDKLLLDAEINYILNTFDEHNLRLYNLYQRIADKFARDIKRSLGPQSEDPTSRQQYYADKAAYYKQLCSTSGVSIPKYSYKKVFRKGMHNNV
jgi:hypothetical protein